MWPGHKFALALFSTVIIVWLGAMAAIMRHGALNSQASGLMLTVFPPSTTGDQAMAKITSAGARPVRRTSFAFIWVVKADEAGLAGRLTQQGAWGS